MRLLRVIKALVLVALFSVFVFTGTQIYANASFELCVEISGGCKNQGCNAAGYSCSREFASTRAAGVDACDCKQETTGRTIP